MRTEPGQADFRNPVSEAPEDIGVVAGDDRLRTGFADLPQQDVLGIGRANAARIGAVWGVRS